MPSDRQPVRFGIFEVNLETGEVCRAGVKVRLQEQPFQVLAALLEKPGEIITKEELQERIWKDDTYVDFDRSLATAVNKVRHALGDSAIRPRFVETVAKRGYRFIGLTGQTPPADAAVTRPLAPGEIVLQRRTMLALMLASTVAALLAGFWSSRLFEEPPDKRVRRFSFAIEGAIELVKSDGDTPPAAISPDGRYIAYTAVGRDGGQADIWVRTLATGTSRALPGTEGAFNAPFWSHDSSWLAFGTFPDRRLKRISLEGGSPIPLAVTPGFGNPLAGGTWSPDGERIVISSSGRLYEVPARGGEPRLLLQAAGEPRSELRTPLFLPTGGGPDAVAYIAQSSGVDRRLAVLNLETGERHELAPGGGPISWYEGHFIFRPESYFSSGLWALPVSRKTLEATGEAFPISPSGSGGSVSHDGTLVYVDFDQAQETMKALIWRR